MNKHIIHLPTGYEINLNPLYWPTETRQFNIIYNTPESEYGILYKSSWRNFLIVLENMHYDLFKTRLFTYTKVCDWLIEHINEFEIVYDKE